MRRAYWLLHTSIFLWGFTGIFGKAISLNEGLLVWYRMGLTALVWLALGRLMGRLQWPGSRAVAQLSGIGVLLALHWLFFYASIKYGNVSVAMSCLALVAVFSSLLEPLLLRTRFQRMQVLLALTGFAGMLLIFRFTEFARTGILLGIVSSLLGSLFTIFNKQLADVHPSETITTYEMISGFLFLTAGLPFYLNWLQNDWQLPSLNDAVLLVLFVIFCTVIPFNLSVKALRQVSAFTANLSLNMEPVYGILLAFVIYQEHQDLDGYFFAGLLLILLSVVFYSAYQWRAARRPSMFSAP